MEELNNNVKKQINFQNNKDELIIDILNSTDLISLFETIKSLGINQQEYIESEEKKHWTVWYSALADNIYYFGTFKQLIYKIKDEIESKDHKLYFDLDTPILDWFEFEIEDISLKTIIL